MKKLERKVVVKEEIVNVILGVWGIVDYVVFNVWVVGKILFYFFNKDVKVEVIVMV